MTASPLLPSTQLALTQEHILARTDYTKEEAANRLHELESYSLLLRTTHNSNLHVRQAFIRAGLRYICRVGVPSVDFTEAMAITTPLFRDGYSIEGPDYCLYIQTAIDWYNDVTRNMAYTVCENACDNYRDIVAPDGTIPVPEASGRVYPVPTTCISNDKYIVQRWPSGSYLLIDVGTECDPENLHGHLSAGYMALWSPYDVAGNLAPEPGWMVRCRAYTGFSWSDVPSDSGLDRLLPPGALRPLWRLRPPKVTVERGDSSVTVTWKYPWLPSVQRRISWSSADVRVEDKSGWLRRVTTRSWVV